MISSQRNTGLWPWFLLAGVLVAGGCAVHPDARTAPDPLAGRRPAALVPDSLAAASPVIAPPDTAQLPPAPDEETDRQLLAERPDLSALDHLWRQALAALAAERADVARDILFTLDGEAQATLPSDRDSVAAAWLASLRRRVSLLAAVTAEEAALRDGAAGDDSLLAAAYDAMRGLDLPDSLIPVSGPARRSIETDLLAVDNAPVRRWLEYFQGPGRRQMATWLERETALDSLVGGILDDAGLPRELIWLAGIESGFNPHAVSSAGAVGMWQFMAGTARHFHLRCDWWVDERRDPEQATRAAAVYLSQLYHRFRDWALVLAAYNTGERRVERAVRLAGHDDFWRLALPWQTRNHVPKFIAAARIAADPARYGFTVKPRPNLAYDDVAVTDATGLDVIARCAGVDRDAVVRLNPALLREATPPGRHDTTVHVPAGTGRTCAARLRRIPLAERLTWRRHTVRRGETLGRIARRYGTTVRDIARVNRIRDVRLIHPGDRLLIPMPAQLAQRAARRTRERGYYVPPEGYQRVRYKVRRGDTLSGIARRLGVTVRHLRRVNNLHHTSLIRPGQVLYAYRPPR